MTYCVAWKTSDSAFLIADTVKTDIQSSQDNSLAVSKTSFGEIQGAIEKNKYISESAFKLHTQEGVAVSLAGDVSFGNSFIELFFLHLSFGRGVREAISHSVKNYPDFNTKPNIQLLFTYYDDEPIVLSLDNKRSTYLEEEMGFVSFGSPSEDLAKYSNAFWNGFKESWESENTKCGDACDRFFLRMIALLQCYGIKNPTLGLGIGGTYTGFKIDKNGVKTQPEICYVITGETIAYDTMAFTSVHVQQDHVCIVNTATNNKVLSNFQSQASSNELIESMNSAIEKFDSGCFDYFIFLNTFRHSASIIHMNNSLHHQLLSIDIQPSLPETIGLIMTEKLNNMFNDNFEVVEEPKYALITYTPFIPATKQKIELVNNQIDNLRTSKIYGEELDTHRFLIYNDSEVTDMFYGSVATALPFIKHYQEANLIRVINIATDLVELEYENGKLIYPEIDFPITEALGNIPKKNKQKDIYLFELLSMVQRYSEIGKYHTVLARDKNDADNQIQNLYKDGNFIFIGKRFYHQAFSF